MVFPISLTFKQMSTVVALQFFNLRVAGPPIISHSSPRALCLPHLDSDRSQQVEVKSRQSHSHVPVPTLPCGPLSQPVFRSGAASYFGTLISSDRFYLIAPSFT